MPNLNLHAARRLRDPQLRGLEVSFLDDPSDAAKGSLGSIRVGEHWSHGFCKQNFRSIATGSVDLRTFRSRAAMV
jgi:hypothetical protein